MTADVVSDLMREGLFIAMVLVSVIIIPSLVVGLIVAVFQAATQINEQTLSFLPRLLGSHLGIDEACWERWDGYATFVHRSRTPPVVVYGERDLARTSATSLC